MTKKSKKIDSPEIAKKKQPGVGAVIGSVLFFILTLLLTVLLLCSTALHFTLTQHNVSRAIERTDFTQVTISDDGKTQSLGAWIYEWYFEGAPGLTAEYAEAVVSQPEIKAVLTDYFCEMDAYLLKESDTMPELSAETFADLLQYDLADTLASETGITFTEEDRTYFLWAIEDDIPDWNADMWDLAGHGFGKIAVRLIVGVPGIITIGILAVLCFALWLIFAIKGHWRKGKMLVGYGTAVAVPSLLVLLGGGILLLLINALDLISSLSFAKSALPLLILPAIWPALAIALCGIIIASIGICINAVTKTKRESAASAESISEIKTTPSDTTPSVSTPPVPESKPIDLTAPQKSTQSSECTICPHCGAQNMPDSRFCGVCGKQIEEAHSGTEDV